MIGGAVLNVLDFATPAATAVVQMSPSSSQLIIGGGNSRMRGNITGCSGCSVVVNAPLNGMLTMGGGATLSGAMSNAGGGAVTLELSQIGSGTSFTGLQLFGPATPHAVTITAPVSIPTLSAWTGAIYLIGSSGDVALSDASALAGASLTVASSVTVSGSLSVAVGTFTLFTAQVASDKTLSITGSGATLFFSGGGSNVAGTVLVGSGVTLNLLSTLMGPGQLLLSGCTLIGASDAGLGIGSISMRSFARMRLSFVHPMLLLFVADGPLPFDTTTLVSPIVLNRLWNCSGIVQTVGSGVAELRDVRVAAGAASRLSLSAGVTVFGAYSLGLNSSLRMTSARVTASRVLDVFGADNSVLSGNIELQGTLQLRTNVVAGRGLNVTGAGDVILDGCTVEGASFAHSGRIGTV
jgi:hypothetical protein